MLMRSTQDFPHYQVGGASGSAEEFPQDRGLIEVESRLLQRIQSDEKAWSDHPQLVHCSQVLFTISEHRQYERKVPQIFWAHWPHHHCSAFYYILFGTFCGTCLSEVAQGGAVVALLLEHPFWLQPFTAIWKMVHKCWHSSPNARDLYIMALQLTHSFKQGSRSAR